MADSAAPHRDFPERLGDFRLLERLGAGGMGVVYRARDEVLSRDVALKVIRPESLHFEEARERFRREVEAAAKLRHPGIVPIYSVGEDAGLPFFAMELVDGRSLADAIEALKDRDPAKLTGADLRAALETRATGAPPPPETRSASEPFTGTWVQACCRLVAQVADALEHAHAHGVLHRDVKPSNVVVTRDGRALLLDFGLASTTESSRITRTGTQAGSLPYMPPERLTGGLAAADATGDVYSLGVTLYELLALRLPFEGESFEQVLRAISAGDATPLAARNSGAPRDAAILCATAMERDPARRYASAAAFARDLRNLLELRPLEARAPSAALRVRRWIQRNPTTAVAVALGFLLLVVAPSVAWWRIRQERDAAVHELAVRREMLGFFLGLLGAGDTEGVDAGTRSVQELVDEGSRRIRGALADQPEVRGPLLAELAKVQNSLGRPREALELADAALELREVSIVPEAELHRLAGSALGQLGEFERSERELELARAAARADGTLDTFADDLELELAANEFRRHELDQADARLAALEEDPNARIHGDTAETVSYLVLRAEIANARGDFSTAESEYQRVLDVVTRLRGREHPQFARHLQNLAVSLNAQGRHAEALPLLLEAREIRARTLQSEGLEDARLAFNIAAVCSRLDRLLESADEYRRALELCRKLTGDSPQTAKAAAGMGSVLVKAGELDRAEPILREALGLSHEYVPRQGWTAVEAPLWLARCLAKRGAHEEAAEHFAAALACLDEKAYGRPDLAAKLEGELADELHALGRDSDATVHRERQSAWLAFE